MIYIINEDWITNKSVRHEQVTILFSYETALFKDSHFKIPLGKLNNGMQLSFILIHLEI